jgi:uncharacterized protein YkwD
MPRNGLARRDRRNETSRGGVWQRLAYDRNAASLRLKSGGALPITRSGGCLWPTSPSTVVLGRQEALVGTCIPIRRPGATKRSVLYLAPLALLIALSLLFLVLFAGTAQAVGYSAEETAFVQLLNEYRVSQGLQPLLVSDMLSEAAERHSSDMGKYDFFNHYTTGGSDWFEIGASPWDRMAASGYTFNTYKGENIAAGFDSAAAAFAGWKSSAGHDANMLGANFKVVGVGLVHVAGSMYGHYWTTDFGGYVDSTAHSIDSVVPSTTTTTAVPSTTTATQQVTTTTARSTTTTTTVVPTTTTVAPTPTTTVAPARTFSDVDGDTLYAAEIQLLSDRGIVDGYGDGTFGPGNLVIRQQFAKMIILTLGYDVSPLRACGFRDVLDMADPGDPLYPGGYIAACAAAGITVGKTPYTFAPYDNVTRAQLITMVARAAGLADPPAGYLPPFADFSPDHYPWAARAAHAGLLNGLAGMGRGFDFWAPATRAEVCLLLANLLER